VASRPTRVAVTRDSSSSPPPDAAAPSLPVVASSRNRPVTPVPPETPSDLAVVPRIPLLFPAYLDFLARRGIQFDVSTSLAMNVVSANGAIFVANEVVAIPKVWMFPNEATVSAFQGVFAMDRSDESRSAIELQKAALLELEAARAEAAAKGLTITPASKIAARRGYQDTVELWNSRVQPGLRYWVSVGRLKPREADRIAALETRQQIDAILKLEESGLWFSLSRDKSIRYSVSVPGTSQHLSMLALDIREHENPGVRALLARHGWFQTVYSDLPHFTFLGIPESELAARGLEARTNAGRTFWVVGVPVRPRGLDDRVEVSDTCAF
jgi:hypothetical protein